MKKILCLSFLASTAIIPSALKAETMPTPVIAIVEQATLDKSSALESIVKQVEKKRAEIQEEMKGYEDKLKAEDKKLAEEQKTMPEKEFTEKRQAFAKQVQKIQDKIEVRRAQMEMAVEDAKKKVYEAFLKAADEVRKESGANIILYKETVVSADSTFDKTADILQKLNKLLPTVPVVFKSEAEIKKLMEEQQHQSPAPAA